MKTFVPTKHNYLTMRGQRVKFRGRVVSVSYHRTKSQGGSWERGFRFYESEWASLVADHKHGEQFSLDHGDTWHPSARTAFKKSKGKMRLSSDSHGEFAFDGIQKIARDWEGPGYRWRR